MANLSFDRDDLAVHVSASYSQHICAYSYRKPRNQSCLLFISKMKSHSTELRNKIRSKVGIKTK